MKKTAKKINQVFPQTFGRTPLRQRIDDIFGEAVELARFTDLSNLQEELGDLLASAIQACNEMGMTPKVLIENTLRKIRRREQQYHSLGRKINVALFGGAFDPITSGHIAVAQLVLNTSRIFDEVWLTPCLDHLNGKQMVAPEYRLAMCEIAARTDGRLKAFDYEIRHKLSGETYHLVKRLLDELFAKDQYDFSMIIGLDNANPFDKWVNYEDLERMIRFVVVPRKGVNPAPGVNWSMRPPHIFLSAENDLPEISSSLVRPWLNRQWESNTWKPKLASLLQSQKYPDVLE